MPSRDQYEGLPDDKEKLEQILKAKQKFLKNMQKTLNDAEMDALENDLLTDPTELTNLLTTMQSRVQELDQVIAQLPKDQGIRLTLKRRR